MANTSRIKGFRVIKSATGAPNNGQANLYYVASAADEILVGDVVKLSGSGDSNGIPGADLCGATDVPVGIVVGVLHSKFDPVGKLTTGSVSLDLPAATQIAASGAGYVLVADDPNVLLEIEIDSATSTDIGANVKHANNSRTSATITSPAALQSSTISTDSTFNFNIRGFIQAVDNELGANARVVVGFNRHQYKSVGTVGI